MAPSHKVIFATAAIAFSMAILPTLTAEAQDHGRTRISNFDLQQNQQKMRNVQRNSRKASGTFTGASQPQNAEKPVKIPDWVKPNAGWWN